MTDHEVHSWKKAVRGDWSEVPEGYSPLNPGWVKWLMTQPESGMGYHVEDVDLINDQVVRATVVNCKMIDVLLDVNMIRNIRVVGPLDDWVQESSTTGSISDSDSEDMGSNPVSPSTSFYSKWEG